MAESFPQDVFQKNVIKSYATIALLNTSNDIKARFKRFINSVYHNEGVLLLAYSGQRNYGAQWELRKKYLAGGNRAAAPGYSWHNFGRAIDTVPVKPDGSADWNSRKWAAIQKIAKQFGLETGRSFGDPGHIRYDIGTSLATERARKPGWQLYSIQEDQTGTTKPKDVESTKQYALGKAAVITGIGVSLFFGGRYLYRRYA